MLTRQGEWSVSPLDRILHEILELLLVNLPVTVSVHLIKGLLLQHTPLSAPRTQRGGVLELRVIR